MSAFSERAPSLRGLTRGARQARAPLREGPYDAIHFFSKGKNMGTLFLYSIYSVPRRFASSGSSIFFNSQMFAEMNSGVKKKNNDMEFNSIAQPNNWMKIPVSIGLRAYL